MTHPDESHQYEQPTQPDTPPRPPGSGSEPSPAQSPGTWPPPPTGPGWGAQAWGPQGRQDPQGQQGTQGQPDGQGYPGYGPPGQGYPGGYAPGGYAPGGYQPGGYQPGYGNAGAPGYGSQWPGPWTGGTGGGGWGPPSGGWRGWSPAGPRRSLPTAVTALLLAVAVLVGLGIGHGVWTSGSSSNQGVFGSGGSGSNSGGSGFGTPNGSFPSNGSGSGTGVSPSLSGPVAAVTSDLVDINVQLYQGDEAEGTGIVLSSNGLVLTNNHVISGATSISVVDIGNGKTFAATVLGYDRAQDVALIQLRGASGLQTAPIGDSSSVAVQDTVVGMGNAGGVGGPPSTAPGQVTALGQSITAQDASTGTSEQLSGLIETNCDIQPGDSGGALVSSAGKVVGMDTAASVGFSFQTQASEGYAIPINQATSIANAIKSGRGGTNIHLGATAFMGVEIKPESGVSGAFVQTAIPGSPAAAAGLGSGDLITNFGGHAVTSPDDLTQLISGDHPGQTVQLTYTDGSGATHTTSLTLASGPPQ
jgi:S1-C subfamily serine protease